MPLRAATSAIVGGGIGQADWVLNFTVEPTYDRLDPAIHVDDVAGAIGLTGRGVGMMTAVDVSSYTVGADAGAEVVATTGVSRPVWAAELHEPLDHAAIAIPPGTINIVAFVPVTMCDGALVNAVATLTEAKVQALAEHGVPGTGTATDTVCVLCPTSGEEDPFGGPRSLWGARLARAGYAAVAAGVERQRRALQESGS